MRTFSKNFQRHLVILEPCAKPFWFASKHFSAWKSKLPSISGTFCVSFFLKWNKKTSIFALCTKKIGIIERRGFVGLLKLHFTPLKSHPGKNYWEKQVHKFLQTSKKNYRTSNEKLLDFEQNFLFRATGAKFYLLRGTFRHKKNLKMFTHTFFPGFSQNIFYVLEKTTSAVWSFLQFTCPDDLFEELPTRDPVNSK